MYNRKIPENYVRMATKLCPVCGIEHDHSDEILMNKWLREIQVDKTCTGWGLCKVHEKLFQDGYIAMVAVSNTSTGETLKQENALRTGEIMHLKREAFNNIFDVQIPDIQELVFIDPEVITLVKEMAGVE